MCIYIYNDEYRHPLQGLSNLVQCLVVDVDCLLFIVYIMRLCTLAVLSICVVVDCLR